MTPEGLNRRRLISASFVAAAAVPLAACSSSGDSTAQTTMSQFNSPKVTPTTSARSVRDFGAIGDGNADDTVAVASAFAQAGDQVVVYFPAGTYKVTSWPEMPDYAAVLGDGADVSTVQYDGTDTLMALRGKQRINFRNMGFYSTARTSTVVSLSGCFRCSFDSVVIRGNHTSDSFPDYVGQRGVVLDENTGGTAFINCDINNFGTGMTTSCIQNYVTSSKFTSNRVGVLGTGNNFNAGLSLTNVEFVSDNDPNTTDKHLFIDGSANDWWLTNVWFEGCDTAASVGVKGIGGPAQFGMVNCKVAARTVCIDVQYCRQPYLANVRFDADPNSTPTELQVDAEGTANGTAIGLISSRAEDIDPAAFPVGWNVIGRGQSSGSTFVSTVVARSVQPDRDLFQAQASDGSVLSSVLPSGTWLSENADAGVVLKDSSNAYWRLTVTTDGRVETASLGTTRPQ